MNNDSGRKTPKNLFICLIKRNPFETNVNINKFNMISSSFQ